MNYMFNTCSICLAPYQKMQIISSQDSDGIVIEEKLKVFLLELIQFKPNVRKFVCNNCLGTLNYIYKFRLQCLENITKLDKYIETIKQPLISSTETTSKYEKVQENLKICVKAKEVQENIIIMNSVFIKTENTENMFDETYQTQEENIVVKQEPEDASNIQMPCQAFKEFNEEIHIKEDTDVTSYNNTSSTETENTAVQTQTANKPKQFKCSFCQKAFISRSHVKVHERIHTGISPYKCSYCPKKFNRANDLSRHERIHTGLKPFACDLCPKAFREWGYLKSHKKIHENPQIFKCKVCGKEFPQSNFLALHMRKHNAGRLYFRCQLCEFKCAKSDFMKLHITNIHGGDGTH